MALLADRSLEAARELHPNPRHELVVAAMASFYLTDPAARTPTAQPIARAVAERFGALACGPVAVFRIRQTLARHAAAPRPVAKSAPARTASVRPAVLVR